MPAKSDIHTDDAWVSFNRWKRLKKTIQNLILGNYHRYKDIDSPAETPYLMFLGDLIE
jgi:hypothetical protein